MRCGERYVRRCGNAITTNTSSETTRTWTVFVNIFIEIQTNGRILGIVRVYEPYIELNSVLYRIFMLDIEYILYSLGGEDLCKTKDIDRSKSSTLSETGM